MRSVLSEEMDIIWSKYRKYIKDVGFKTFLEAPDFTLRKGLSLEFKNLYDEVRAYSKRLGRKRNQVKYSVLKLRRLIALWYEKGVITGDFKVYYKKDFYKDFPLFGRQNFDVVPTVQTINKIKATIISNIIDEYNNRVQQMRSAGNCAYTYITDLKQLRLFLMQKLDIEEEMATKLTSIYREHSAKGEVAEFSDGLKIS